MKRYGLFQKATARLLALAMTATLLPALPVSAAGGYVAVPENVNLGVGLLNVQSMSSPQFFAEHVRSRSGTSLNLEFLFQNRNSSLAPLKYSPPKGAVSGQPLNFSTAYTRQSNDNMWQGLYEAPYTGFEPVVQDLAKSGQIQYNLSASLKRDYHGNLVNHKFSKTSDEARVELYDSFGKVYGRKLLSFEGKESDPNRTYVRYGDESAPNWHPFTIPASQSTGTCLSIKFGTNESCACGSSGVKDLAFALADNRYPTVTGITLTDAGGAASPKTHLKAGEKGYIALTFSEPIRFASEDPPKLDTIPLALTMSSLDLNAQVSKPDFKAFLVKLTENAMIFQFTVPESINTAITNHLVFGVDQEQTWVNSIGQNDFPLTLYRLDGMALELGPQSSKQESLTATSSLVTDLAGNPVDWNASVKVISSFVVDNKPPTVDRVELSGPRMSLDNYKTPENGLWPPDIDRGAVFLGQNDQFYATVVLSEEMIPLTDEQTRNTRATFNLDQGNGVFASAPVAYSYSDTEDGNRTKLVFGPLTINGAPPSIAPTPIRVTKMTFAAGITDLSGNPIASTLDIKNNPLQQLWVDTESPWVTLDLNEAPGDIDGWVPLYYDADDKDSFYVPIRMGDKGNFGNPAYTSGLENITGTFALNTLGLPYRFTATYNAERPDPGAYQEGVQSGSFTQTSGLPIYLHFQLIDGIPYNFDTLNLHITIRDYAWNVNAAQRTLAQKGDGVGPIISFSRVDKTFDGATRTGAMEVFVSVADDVSNLAGVEYRWSDTEDWTTAGLGPDPGKSCTFSHTVSGLAEGKTHTKTLIVKAVDTEGNVRETPFICTYDLEKAAYSYRLEFDRLEAPGNYPDYQNKITENQHPIWVDAPPLYRGDDAAIPADAATTLFLIEDRLSTEANDYFVRTFTTKADGANESGYVYKSKNGYYTDPDFSRWYHATYQQEGDTYTFANVVPLDSAEIAALPEARAEWESEDQTTDFHSPESEAPAPQDPGAIVLEGLPSPDELKSLQTRLDNQWRGYYGDQNIILLTAYGDYSVPQAFESNLVAVESLTYRSASYPFDEAQGGIPPHEVEFGAPLAPGGAETDLEPERGEYRPDDPDSLPRYPDSLAGSQIPFTISNRYAPGWNADDVDFERSKVTLTYLGFTKDSATDENEWALDFPLTPGTHEQRFTFPTELDGKTYQSGYYSLRVTLNVLGAGARNKRNQADGMRTVATFNKIFLYVERPDSYGMSDFNTNIWYQGQFAVTLFRDTDPPVGDYFTSVKLGSGEEPGFTRTQELAFSLNGLPDHWPGISTPAFWKDLTKVYWQVWNGDDPDGAQNAPYAVLSENFGRIDVNMVDAIGPGDYQTPEGAPAIPILKGQARNTVCYRFALQNGYISPVRQLTAHVRGGRPDLKVSWSPEAPADGSPVNRVEMTFDKAYSPNGNIVYYTLLGKRDAGAYDPFTVEITESGDYTAVIVDEYGNATAADVPIHYVDGMPPILDFGQNLSDTPGEFRYQLTIDDDRPITTGRLQIGQANGKDAAAIWGEVPIPYEEGVWEAGSPQPSGVYAAKLLPLPTPEEGLIPPKMILEISGVYPYLEGSAVRDRWVHFDISDDLGNRYAPTTDESNSYPDTKPECTEVTYDPDQGLVLTFNTLVRLGESGCYSRIISGLPIYEDGTHEIVFQDLFGNSYTQEVKVDSFGELGLEADLSETGPTNQDVVVTLAAKGDGVIQSITMGDAPALEVDGPTTAVTVTENTVLNVAVWNGREEGSLRIYPVAVTNIDREPPEAEVRITYAVPPVDGKTSGDVTASLHCAEPIEALEGTDLTYTFQFGGPTQYTFRYRDEAGNEGEAILFTCPVEITGEGEKPEGLSYEVEFQQKLREVYTTCLRYGSGEETGLWTAGVAAADSKPAQGYRLSFETPTRGVRLFVTQPGADAPGYDSGAGSPVEGVAASGLVVTVSDNAAFRVWLVDRWDNAASLDVALSNIDATTPTAGVDYVYQTGGIVRAYLDGLPEGTTVTNRAGVAREAADNGYRGRYYHDFTENGVFLFYLENQVGTTGQAEAKVTTLDTAAPAVLSVKWSGIVWPKEGEPPPAPTNRPIAAHFSLDKNVREVEVRGIAPEVIDQHITVAISGHTVTVTYLQNTPVLTLIFTALNGKTTEETLPAVANMDLTPPKHSDAVVETAPDKRSATISFRAEADVRCAQIPVHGSDLSEPLLPWTFSAKVWENGAYRFHLTDAAGNAAWVEAVVTEIDPATLTLQYSHSSTGEGAVDYAFQLGRLKDHKIYVKPSKTATLVYSVDDAPKTTISNAHAGAWAGPFPIQEVNGAHTYTITATDHRGEEVSAFLNVLPPDITPPVILTKRPTAPVPQNATMAELEALLAGNLKLVDDRSDPENVRLEFNLDGVRLSETGFQNARVKATDEAGNTSRDITVSFRVYGPDDLYAIVGGRDGEEGELVFPNGTALTPAGSVSFQILNLPEGEPYMVRIKDGYKTTGQMKTGATPVTGGVMTLEAGRYYTVYVRAQDRKELLFYVLAE